MVNKIFIVLIAAAAASAATPSDAAKLTAQAQQLCLEARYAEAEPILREAVELWSQIGPREKRNRAKRGFIPKVAQLGKWEIKRVLAVDLVFVRDIPHRWGNRKFRMMFGISQRDNRYAVHHAVVGCIVRSVQHKRQSQSDQE